jgi:hypothetical protein
MKKWLGLAAGIGLAGVVAACSGSGGGDGGGNPTPTPTPTSVGTHFHWDNPTFSEPPGEEYRCFYVDVPTGGTTNGQVGAYKFSYAPATGLHHMVIFTDTDTTSHANGSNAVCGLFENTWTIRYAGGTVTDPLTLPAGVAMPMNATQRFVFQFHLLNASGSDLPIHTSVDIDFTKPTDTYTHAQVVLGGTESINIPAHSTGQAVGVCNLPAQVPNVHSFAVWPHMHQLGTNFKIEITHASTTTTLLDQPWNFGDQPVWYPPAGTTLDLTGGDTITTTCSYNNTTDAPVGFGESSTSEMCYDFFYYYPAVIDASLPCGT